jgi:hypothetical protein
MLPVPLNSSKITSSIFDPCPTRAVPMMVSEPPRSMARAAPKNFLGRCSALESRPPDMILPECGISLLYAAGETRDRVEQDHHVLPELHHPLRLLDHDLRDRDVPAACSSKVLATTSTDGSVLRLKSVTSPGARRRAAR